MAKLISINDFVNGVYYINLDRRRDRLKHIKSELKKHDIKATRFEAIDAHKLNIVGNNTKIGAIGALRSHRGVIEKALKKNQNIICVMEDDIIFCDDLKERFDFYVKYVPKDWDIMYLGCHFHGCEDPIYIGKSIYRVVECFGCFAMILNNKNGLFQKILEASEKEDKPIDDCINYNVLTDKNIKAYVFKPFFVKTMDTISDISEEVISYSYEAVNKHFENIFEEDKIPLVIPVQPTPPPPPPINKYMSQQDICENYLRRNNSFIIIYNGRIIFDSETTDKNNLYFSRDYFTLYGRSFSYVGMIIKNK